MIYISKDGVSLSKLMFGCWGISGDWKDNKTEDFKTIQLIEKAIEKGVNFFDMAAVYGNGAMEEIFRNFSNNKNLFLATKVPAKKKPVETQIETDENYYDKSYIVSQFQASLKRIGRQQIDLLQLHNWHKSWNERIEYFVGPLLELKKTGAVRWIGVSLPDGYNEPFDNLAMAGVDFIQLSLNEVDNWARMYVDEWNKPDTKLIIRSLFMQGILGKTEAEIARLNVQDVRVARYLARKERVDAARGEMVQTNNQNYWKEKIEEVSKLVGDNFLNIGMRTSRQLAENCNAVK